MIDKNSFDYLTDWLVSAIKPQYDKSDVKKWAAYDGKLNKGTVSKLWQLFDMHVCEGSDKRMRIAEGELYVFNGKWFEKVQEKTFLKELVRRVLTQLGVSPTYRLYGASRIADELMARIANTEECQYKPDRRYIVFSNGTFDTADGKLKKFSISYCTDLILSDVEYMIFEHGETKEQSEARRLWEQKLKEIIPNKDFQKAFQQFCGSLLLNRDKLKVEYICYLCGTGSNGKSVLASAVANVFGEKYYSTFSPVQLFKEGNSSMFNLKELQGKVLNVCDDLTDKDFSGGEFKRFISGERFKARGVYAKDFAMIQPPMMLVCANAIPETQDDSYGHHRRQLPIFTTKTQFVGDKRDPNLTAKLSTPIMRSAIFWWIYQGFRALRSKNGNIEIGEAVKEAIEGLMADSSPMRRWAKDKGLCYAEPRDYPCKECKEPRWKPLKEWFAEYQEYCIENGYAKPTDSRKLSGMFKSMGFKSHPQSRPTYYCIGIKGYDTTPKGAYIDPKLNALEDVARKSGNIL